ncbi:AtpZ/AtpI family protein [Fulvivirga sp. RKSG066]|uniref:AtpZ/AtpI family protein n=1 Tax=Fulvivirga aurantia TaxID=2529383 RepID=UPI0012BB9C02|nr:AtpZ/AtpI family protein [Fulvivirga aurantia]
MGSQKKPSSEKEPRRYNDFVKYSGLAIQMAVAIYLGHLLGVYLDEKTGNTNELYSKIVTLLAVFLSIFMVIRQVTKSSSNND